MEIEEYLDGGSIDYKCVEFDDYFQKKDVEIVQDNRLNSKTKGIYYLGHPDDGNELNLEDYIFVSSIINKTNLNLVNEDVKLVTTPNGKLKPIQVNFRNESSNENPEYATEGASAFDIRCSESGFLKSGEFKAINTGLYFELPEGFDLRIFPRSGLAFKNGITVLNSLGLIDNDYVGEVKVILINHSKVDFEYSYGDRIAQGVISAVTAKNSFNFNQVNEFTKETERGKNGFGSTGIK
jgi:dUTP pyrophosphatase